MNSKNKVAPFESASSIPPARNAGSTSPDGTPSGDFSKKDCEARIRAFDEWINADGRTKDDVSHLIASQSDAVKAEISLVLRKVRSADDGLQQLHRSIALLYELPLSESLVCTSDGREGCAENNPPRFARPNKSYLRLRALSVEVIIGLGLSPRRDQGRFDHPVWHWLDAIVGATLLSFTIYLLTAIGNAFS